MAVPKKKISKSRGGLRKGGNGAYRTEFPNVVTNKTTGEYMLPHHISSDGYYKGKKVIKTKKDKSSEKETNPQETKKKKGKKKKNEE